MKEELYLRFLAFCPHKLLQNIWVPVWEQPLIGILKTSELQNFISASRRTSLVACECHPCFVVLWVVVVYPREFKFLWLKKFLWITVVQGGWNFLNWAPYPKNIAASLIRHYFWDPAWWRQDIISKVKGELQIWKPSRLSPCAILTSQTCRFISSTLTSHWFWAAILNQCLPYIGFAILMLFVSVLCSCNT
jgi:hypothetical protein